MGKAWDARGPEALDLANQWHRRGGQASPRAITGTGHTRVRRHQQWSQEMGMLPRKVTEFPLFGDSCYVSLGRLVLFKDSDTGQPHTTASRVSCGSTLDPNP